MIYYLHCLIDIFEDLPINGGWSEWGNWSDCSEGCLATRSRVCDNPPPLYRGLTCPDNDTGDTCIFYIEILKFSLYCV